MKWRFYIGAVLISLICSVGIPAVTSYADDKIYVAGIPDGYPIEYYDREKEQYDGILPQLLYRIGREQDLEFYYLEPSSKDKREDMAEKRQVDLFCTYGLGEERLRELGAGDPIKVFTYKDGSIETDIYLAFTKTMPEGGKRRLNAAIKALDQVEIDELTETYHDLKAETKEALLHYFNVAVVIAAVLLLLILLLLLLLKRQRMLAKKTRYTDDITGYDNFNMWLKKYNAQIVNENRNHYALIQISTGIEFVNRIYGYQEADKALKVTASVLLEFLNTEKEAAARTNGFEFVLYIQYRDEKDIKDRILTMERSLSQAFADERYILDFQAGIYQLQTKDSDPMDALKYSEIMMRYAVEHHLDYAFYSVMIEKESIADYSLEHEAVRGLMKNEFLMYLQPIIDLQNDCIAGAEVLVRWQNPLRGLLKPGEFMHAMRKKSLAAKMNLMLFEKGCIYLQMLGTEYGKIKLLFNFDAQNIADEDFADSLINLAEKYHISPEQIIIQLNQIIEITQQKQFRDVISRMIQYGFNICLAGLELDRVFNEFIVSGISMIKLRRELLNSIGTESGNIILKNLLNLCHELKLHTFCVGVETPVQKQFLINHHCELATGHYFYYPLTCEAYAELLRKQKSNEM